jgi:hypothetical protein
MKIRVCPNCGKENLKDAFNCIDCGATLSVKTIMDSESEKLLIETLGAGNVTLLHISPAFQKEIKNILKALPDDETSRWGCNITSLSAQAPFKFGFLIITTHRLILTYFESDLDYSGFPERSNLAFLPPTTIDQENIKGSVPLLWALDAPQTTLTRSELDSKSVISYMIKNLSTANLIHYWFGNSALTGMVLKFNQTDDVTPAFLIPEDARETPEEITITFITPEDAQRALALSLQKGSEVT